MYTNNSRTHNDSSALNSNISACNKIQEIYEQSFDPICTPILIGNDCYVQTQRDVRNIIDTRHITYSKCPNGIKDIITFMQRYTLPYNNNNVFPVNPSVQGNNMPSPPHVKFSPGANNPAFHNHQQHLHQQHIHQQQQQAGQNSFHSQWQTEPNFCQLSALNQLDCEMAPKETENSTHFTYGVVTSTNDLNDYTPTCNNEKVRNQKRILKYCISKGVGANDTEIDAECAKLARNSSQDNLDEEPTAQQQLKLKKIKACHSNTQ